MCWVSCVWVCMCVCVTQGWLTNHLEARCRLQNYFFYSILPSFQLLLVPWVNPWTLTSLLLHGYVSLSLCVCLPGWVNGKVVTFFTGHECSLTDLWSSSSLIDPASIVLQLSPSWSALLLCDQVQQLIKTPKCIVMYFLEFILQDRVRMAINRAWQEATASCYNLT